MRKKTVERGQMAIRKPGRMRWTYTSPEPKVFVSDGVKLYSYVPADKQVYVATVPTGDEASTPGAVPGRQGPPHPRLHGGGRPRPSPVPLQVQRPSS